MSEAKKDVELPTDVLLFLSRAASISQNPKHHTKWVRGLGTEAALLEKKYPWPKATNQV